MRLSRVRQRIECRVLAVWVLAFAGCLCAPLAAAEEAGAVRSSPEAMPPRPSRQTWPDGFAEYDAALADTPEYRAIQQQLATGWNTWDSRSVLRFVLLPQGLTIDLGLKRHDWLEESHLAEALIGRSASATEPSVESIQPDLHALDGSYMALRVAWQGLEARVEAGRDGDDLVALIVPQGAPEAPFELVVSAALAWNRPGAVALTADGFEAQLPSSVRTIHVVGATVDDPYTRTLLPHRVARLDEAVGISSGRRRDIREIRQALDRQRAAFMARAGRFGALQDAYAAVVSAVAWNTVYEPRHRRVVSTVGRLWNEEYGGFALFGWDNFFLAYLAALDSREMAYANVVEHLRGRTAEGFLPNDNRGNGSKSWDRSQPPVGAIMVREVFRRYPERWFLDAVFEPLLAWNRWWPTKRLNQGLLAYGSHAAPNPFGEPAVRTQRTARYESGMDDSPMYEGVPFNRKKNVLEMQDVGLTSLYIADCRALAEMALALERPAEAAELEQRAARFAQALDRLWVDERGYYLNYRTDLERFSERRSPTLFYPLLARVANPQRAQRLIEEHLRNPDEFWGEWLLPSISRDDPAFARQRYWQGAIWPPLNFLTYLGLRNAGDQRTAGELASRSLDMFLAEWRRKGYVSENYSAINGSGDDERLSSDPFHSWGALFGIMAFIDAGHLAPPEAPLPALEKTQRHGEREVPDPALRVQ